MALFRAYVALLEVVPVATERQVRPGAVQEATRDALGAWVNAACQDAIAGLPTVASDALDDDLAVATESLSSKAF